MDNKVVLQRHFWGGEVWLYGESLKNSTDWPGVLILINSVWNQLYSQKPGRPAYSSEVSVRWTQCRVGERVKVVLVNSGFFSEFQKVEWPLRGGRPVDQTKILFSSSKRTIHSGWRRSCGFCGCNLSTVFSTRACGSRAASREEEEANDGWHSARRSRFLQIRLRVILRPLLDLNLPSSQLGEWETIPTPHGELRFEKEAANGCMSQAESWRSSGVFSF